VYSGCKPDFGTENPPRKADFYSKEYKATFQCGLEVEQDEEKLLQVAMWWVSFIVVI